MQEKADVNRRILNVAPCQASQMPECKAARRGELQDIAMPCFASGSVGRRSQEVAGEHRAPRLRTRGERWLERGAEHPASRIAGARHGA